MKFSNPNNLVKMIFLIQELRQLCMQKGHSSDVTFLSHFQPTNSSPHDISSQIGTPGGSVRTLSLTVKPSFSECSHMIPIFK